MTTPNAATSNNVPVATRLVGLTESELVELYREAREWLRLNQNPAITDNSNLVGVRLTLEEKRALGILAAMHKRTTSDELRVAIRKHLARPNRPAAASLSETGAEATSRPSLGPSLPLSDDSD